MAGRRLFRPTVYLSLDCESARYKPAFFPGSSDCYEQAQAVLVKQILHNGVNIGIPDKARYELSLMPDAYSRFVRGSKCYWSSWWVYVSLIWSLKACTLFLFNRITWEAPPTLKRRTSDLHANSRPGLWQQKVVKYTAALVGLSYIAIILSFCLQCRPIQGNWQIYPNPGRKLYSESEIELVG
jgi:hypothetical protein